MSVMRVDMVGVIFACEKDVRTFTGAQESIFQPVSHHQPKLRLTLLTGSQRRQTC